MTTQMRVLISLIIVLCLNVSAFAQDSAGYYGQKITETDAIPATQLATKLTGKEAMPAKVVGTVESVCRMQGCWMKLKTGDGQTMRVTFRDYGFFVPKDIAGKTVVVEGVAEVSTTSVVDLQHYAEDAGKSKAEIRKITKPEKALTFVADGVIVKN